MSERPISVLFLTRYPVLGASSRYRVFQYIPHLERMGFECTVQSFMDEDMYLLSIRQGKTGRKLFATARALLKRMKTVLGHRKYDIVYMQRELLPLGPPVLERWLKRRGATLFFDYDDALFIKKPSRYNPIATFFRSPSKTRKIFGLVDCTVAGNDWLRDMARSCGGHAVTVEVAEDAGRFAPPVLQSANKPVTIGWLGSPSTVKYMSEIEAVLRGVAERHPNVQWEMMGSGEFDMEGVPWTLSDWSIEAERRALERYDIGLMPLPMQEWSRGKSGGKARTYMAAGVVPVVSAIGYNLELIREGETGFLCADQDDWERALEMLLGDAALRERIALAARREVEDRFSPAGKAEELAALFHQAVANEDGR